MADPEGGVGGTSSASSSPAIDGQATHSDPPPQDIQNATGPVGCPANEEWMGRTIDNNLRRHDAKYPQKCILLHLRITYMDPYKYAPTQALCIHTGVYTSIYIHIYVHVYVYM